MAAPRSSTKEIGETVFANVHGRAILYIKGTGGGDKPPLILMDSVDSSGTVKTWGLWVDNTGVWRTIEIGNSAIASIITNEDSDGTKVGLQS